MTLNNCLKVFTTQSHHNKSFNLSKLNWVFFFLKNINILYYQERLLFSHHTKSSHLFLVKNKHNLENEYSLLKRLWKFWFQSLVFISNLSINKNSKQRIKQNETH